MDPMYSVVFFTFFLQDKNQVSFCLNLCVCKKKMFSKKDILKLYLASFLKMSVGYKEWLQAWIFVTVSIHISWKRKLKTTNLSF